MASSSPVKSSDAIALVAEPKVTPIDHWTSVILGLAGTGAHAAMSLARPLLGRSLSPGVLRKGGAALRDLREAAGLSVRDLGRMIDLSDTSVLDLMESGKVAIPLEIVLRLAAVLGRNDPIPFVLRFVRQSNPTLARTLEQLGVGQLIAHAEREREFLNLYRSRDALRDWSEAEFKGLVSFVEGAVELAIAQREQRKAATPSRPAKDTGAARGTARGKPAKRAAKARAASE